MPKRSAAAALDPPAGANDAVDASSAAAPVKKRASKAKPAAAEAPAAAADGSAGGQEPSSSSSSSSSSSAAAPVEKKARKAALPPHACSGPDPSTFAALPFLPCASMAAFVQGLPARPSPATALKVLCYNVNGLRGAIKGERRAELLAWLAAEDPDILCIQEVKADEEAVAKEKLGEAFPGLPHAYFACGEPAGAGFKKGYAGVAIFSKAPALGVAKGLGDPAHDGVGRVLTLTFPWGTLVNVYAPNSGQALDKLEYRTTQFDPAFRAHLSKLRQGNAKVLVMGDFNVAHQNCDVTAFKESRNKTAGFCDAERENFALLLQDGYVDVWRAANPANLQYSE